MCFLTLGLMKYISFLHLPKVLKPRWPYSFMGNRTNVPNFFIITMTDGATGTYCLGAGDDNCFVQQKIINKHLT